MKEQKSYGENYKTIKVKHKINNKVFITTLCICLVVVFFVIFVGERI